MAWAVWRTEQIWPLSPLRSRVRLPVGPSPHAIERPTLFDSVGFLGDASPLQSPNVVNRATRVQIAGRLFNVIFKRPGDTCKTIFAQFIKQCPGIFFIYFQCYNTENSNECYNCIAQRYINFM
jgi:hypothetical protein